MVFSSLNFLFVFLPVVLLGYFIMPRRFRNTLLFIASLIFYAWGEPVYIVLMLFSTVVDYLCGLMVHRNRRTSKAKLAVIVSVLINLSLLGFFKYGDFLLENINSLLGTSIPPLNLPLPIGISFYTFQTMTYTIDVYRGEAPLQKNIISFGTYVTLFPQLIAGPIVRYQTVAEQLNDKHRESMDNFASGILKFIAGLGKKVLLANNIGMVWTSISALPTSQMSVLGAWLGLLAFSFQIYFDFSGYSDMAIGLGRMFGFHFLENFNYPYISKSITEFWRRWHISLGTWFKEYVYIPLGGNKRGLPKQLRNIAIVWVLTGIWHGASWNFAVWGVYFCALLLLEKLFLLKLLQRVPSLLSHLYTLFFVGISWVIFSFESLPQGLSYIGMLFGGGGIPLTNASSLYMLQSNAVLLLLLFVACTPLINRLYHKWMDKKQNGVFRGICLNAGMVALFVLCIAYLVDSTYNPFLYFRF
ncbi:MBOAT family protein [Clostridia bacterium OttesenSCG-928-F22]|nr:MBOAT family protein [Clostridia bacterium OttesenSCG-928-F22]